MSLISSVLRPVFYTMEDFMEQTLVMKAVIAWGWLSVIVMVVMRWPGLVRPSVRMKKPICSKS